jgi:hypothetical protein
MSFDVVVDEAEFRRARGPQLRKLREFARGLRDETYLGDRLRKVMIPRRFRALDNLFRLELPEGWRALYTVRSDPRAGDSIRIVWIGNHTRYERLFGY